MFVTGSSQASNASSSYQIANSLRFQSASATYATRVFGTPTNQRKFTYSLWVKLGLLSINSNLLGACTGATNDAYFQIYSNQLVFGSYTGVGQDYGIKTAAVFRDPSAWYHVVCVFDTANATAADRASIYINGIRQTVTNAANGMFPLNFTNLFNSAVTHGIGIRPTYGDYQLDAYIAEVNFIDGQALTPASFGATNPYSGQWVATKYLGTYGTNGFYLPFSNGTSTTTLGYDSSGNSNNWTLNNFTRSAGTTDCWMYDVPSGNGSAGTQPNSNYAVLNALAINGGDYSTGTVSGSNLIINSGAKPSTVAPASGKFYWEVTIASSGTPSSICGIDLPSNFGANTGKYQSWVYDGTTFVNYVRSGVVLSTWAVNDVLMFALDIDSGKMYVGKNGTWQNSANPSAGTSPNFTFTASQAYNAVVGAGTASANANFGQRSFAYTPPSGFKALCTGNLPASSIVKGNQYMDATLYTGTGSTLSVTNAASFKPDFVWIKSRSNAYTNALYDSIRGIGKLLQSQSTNAERGNSGDLLGAFNSNGFSVNTAFEGGSDNSTDGNGSTFVGWQWQAGKGVKSTNTDGTLASVVSVSKAAGFSIATFDLQATGVATVGHGLGVAPSMVIVKYRNTASTWFVWHTSISAGNYLALNSTTSVVSAPTIWNSTAPNSSVITLGAAWSGSGLTAVAYSFAEIAGFSKFGSYTGNGSTDGPFVYLGFRPKFIMTKRSDGVGSDWTIWDASRAPYNLTSWALYAQASNAEAGTDFGDFLSNGVKLRQTIYNVSGGTYIYMAFAENPFANANAR